MRNTVPTAYTTVPIIATIAIGHRALATGKQLDHGLFDKRFGIFLLHCCLCF